MALAAGCGGDASGPTSGATPALPAPTTALVVLDEASFDRLVLQSALPCLVEFQLPT